MLVFVSRYFIPSAVQVVDKLKERGLYTNSYMIFLSDNGGNPASGGNNFPLRGAKKTLYEGGCRVPAFVHSPLLSSGVFSELAHAVDWLPTIVFGFAKVEST